MGSRQTPHHESLSESSSVCPGRFSRATFEQFGVSPAWVRRIKQERRETGKTAPATTRQTEADLAAGGGADSCRIRDAPDQTLDGLQTSLSRTTLCRALQGLQLTLKKKS